MRKGGELGEWLIKEGGELGDWSIKGEGGEMHEQEKGGGSGSVCY